LDFDAVEWGSECRSQSWNALLAKVPAPHLQAAQLVVDLGCGMGAHTVRLAEDCLEATVIGVDQSAEMIGWAKPRSTSRIHFVRADISDWRPKRQADLVFSHYCLHWVPHHAELLSHLATYLADSGVLAVGMVNPFDIPMFKAIRATADQPEWGVDFSRTGLLHNAVHSLRWYLERLESLGLQLISAGDEVHIYRLESAAALVKWIKWSLLGPFLDRLDLAHQNEFLNHFEQRIHEAYARPGKRGITLYLPTRYVVCTRAAR